MQAHPLHLLKLAVVALAFIPAIALAVAPPATSQYSTDTVNVYVQDQVSKDMEELNGFLCLINAMAPNLLVNEPDYIAMVDLKACRPNTGSSSGGTGSGSSNTGSSYLSVQLNSSRESNKTPMKTKVWLEDFVYSSTNATTNTTTNTNISVPMYIEASQAPGTTAPYGVFRLDYCKQFPTDTSCTKRIGYIDASKTGLAFYTLDYKIGSTGSEYYDEFALQLGANTTTNSGSGIVIKTNTNNPQGTVNTSAIVFAHSPDYFYRDDGSNNPQCFNRGDRYAEESVWRYGLYYASGDHIGERFNHQTGFPVEYTDNSGVTSSGFIGYWGLWMPVTVTTGATLTQISYDTFPPTKKNYTLLQAGGKLTKYSTNFKTLTELHKLPIWYYPNANVLDAGGTTTIMAAYSSNVIFWDNVAQQFYLAQQYVTNPSSGSYDLVKLPTPIAIPNASMVAADTYLMGLSGWSEAIGGQFNIKYTDFQTLSARPDPNAIRVITQTQDVIYPKDYAAINLAGGLKCITDCPTVASISAFNTAYALANYNFPQFTFPSYDYTISSSPILYSTLSNGSYSLDPLTGNMLEGAPISGGSSGGSPVIQDQSYSIYSGRLITGTDMDYIALIRSCATTPCSASDIDLLADQTGITSYSYYTWETSNYSYNQMGFLIDNTTTPATTLKFYPPLPVSFEVPNKSKYGSAAGSIISLQYNDFGNLWGIPYKCVDLRNNGDCVYSSTATVNLSETVGATTYVICTIGTTGYDPRCSTTITPWDKQYWTAQYSIPFDPILGVVTAMITQGDPLDSGYVTKGTQFLVKALEKELRLSKVPNGICTVLGLDQPISVTKLPSSDQWVDPTPVIGGKTILSPVPAPRVIHGVKKY